MSGIDRSVAFYRAIVAGAAGAGAVTGSYAAAGFRPSFVIEPVSSFLTDVTPAAAVTWAIENLGDLGQQLVLIASIGIAIASFAALAYAAMVTGDLLDRRWAAPAITAVAGTLASATLTGATVPSLATGIAAGFVVAAGVLGAGGPAYRSSDRRRAIRSIAAAIGLFAVGAMARTRAGQSETSGGSGPTSVDEAPVSDSDPVVSSLLDDAAARSVDVSGLEGLVSEDFYQVDINVVDPDVGADGWSLQVTGAIPDDRSLSYDDLLDRPAQHRFVTLRCVGEELNGKKMDTALWTGVPIGPLLDEFDVPEECCVQLRAADDYFQAFPLSALRNGFLAYRMNGARLPRWHGHPVRALIPGHWGEINVKWLTEIEIREEPATGYWEQRGWHGTGPVETVAKIHAVNRSGRDTIQVGGHAYAGTRGVDRVEVSVDGGDAWTAATLSEPLPGAVTEDGDPLRETAEDAWRMWEHTYRAEAPHEVVVRAVDGTGRVQPSEESDPFPRGASGWVSRSVDP